MTDPPRGQRVWSHRGLTDAVAPATARQGLPDQVPFRWRDRNTRPMEIVQVRLDLIRAGLCPGVSCMRLARRECRAICAYPADGDAPTVVFTVSPAFTPDALDAAS